MEEPAIRQGVYVTAFYIVLFYVCLMGQSAAKCKLRKAYTKRGERVSPPPAPMYSVVLLSEQGIICVRWRKLQKCGPTLGWCWV